MTTWARVQSNSKTQTSSASTVTLAPTTANLTAGNRLIVIVGCQGSATRTISSVVDNATGGSNTYTAEASSVEASDTMRLSMYSAQIVNGGGSKPTITVTFSGTTFWAWIALVEYSSLATTAGVIADVSAVNNNTANATAWSTGTTAATHAANELVVAAACDPLGMNTADVTYGSSLTKIASDFNNGTTDWTVAEKDSGASGSTIAGSWTSPTARPYAAVVAVFKLAAGGGTAYTSTLAGGMSFAGAATKAGSHTATGALSSAGSTTKAATRTVAGGLASSGSVSKLAQRTLAASSSFTGSASRQAARTLAGAVTSSGTVSRRATRTVSGAVTSSGTAARRASRTVTGGLTSSGAISVTRLITVTLTAALSFTGSATRQASKAVTGTLTPNGTATRAAKRTLGGGLAFVGTASRSAVRTLTAGLTSSGSVSVSRLFRLSLSSALSFTGTATRQASRTLTAGASFSGQVSKRASRTVTATVGFAGQAAKRADRLLSAVAGFVGSVTVTGGSPPPPPTGFTFVTLTGRLVTVAGDPVVGAPVYAWCSAALTDATGRRIPKMMRSTVTASDGTWSLVLAATDDTGTTPTGATYTVEVNDYVGYFRPVTASLPAASAPTVNLAQLVA